RSITISQHDEVLGTAKAIKLPVPLVDLAHLGSDGSVLQLVERNVLPKLIEQGYQHLIDFIDNARAVVHETRTGKGCQCGSLPALSGNPVDLFEEQAIFKPTGLL